MNEQTSKPIRSPSYPNMSLGDAVDAVAKIERLYRSSAVDRVAAAKLIGYTSLSGPANKALAALASYGLLERAGKGETRVTGRARAILHADNEEERRENLLLAASEPDLFRELRERFNDIPVPPEDGVVTYLNRQGFNPTAVRPAARAFLNTMSFIEELGANESHGTKSPARAHSEASEGSGPTTFGGAKAGDLVQWEINGALQMEKPMRVRMVSDDGQWIAVEGSETGIPMSQVIVEERGAATPPRFKIDPPAASETEAALLPGETEWMRNSLGRETKVRLFVSGQMGAKEITKLITLLEAQRLVLVDDDQ